MILRSSSYAILRSSVVLFVLKSTVGHVVGHVVSNTMVLQSLSSVRRSLVERTSSSSVVRVVTVTTVEYNSSSSSVVRVVSATTVE